MPATVDREAQTVTARLLGMAPRTAVHRQGLGCTLAIDTSVEALRAESPRWDPAPALAERPWPVGDLVDRARPKLAAAVDYAFAELDPERPILTRALVIVYRGQLIAERCAEGIDAATPLLGPPAPASGPPDADRGPRRPARGRPHARPGPIASSGLSRAGLALQQRAMRVPPLRLNHVVSGLILLLCGAAVLWHGFVTGAWAWGLVFGALVPAVGLTQIYKLVYMPTRIDVGEVLVATLALAVAGTSADALEAVAARATGIETRVDP